MIVLDTHAWIWWVAQPELVSDHAEESAPSCQHDWRDHDVLVWDNASVQHKAGGNFGLGEPRRFWRYMIAGGRPT